MSWTDERIEALTKMWEGGATASQIAEVLGGVSRNAVIGKAHRLGLKARPSPVKSGEKGEPTESPAIAPHPVAAQPTMPQADGEAAASAVSVADPDEPSENELREGAAEGAASMADETASDDAEDEAAPVAARPARDKTTAAASGASIPVPLQPRVMSVGPGGFLRQGPGDQQAPIPPAPPRRLVPAKPSPDIADRTSLLDLSDRICRWPMGHPGEPDFHFCGEKVNPGFPYCVEHCGRAYQAQLPRGARRPPPPLPFGGPRVR